MVAPQRSVLLQLGIADSAFDICQRLLAQLYFSADDAAYAARSPPGASPPANPFQVSRDHEKKIGQSRFARFSGKLSRGQPIEKRLHH
jgi:hypothetical protein